MLRMRTLPAGFIVPCLPTKTDKLPSGGLWLHEIKHDGFRIIARKDGERVRLYSRPGNDSLLLLGAIHGLVDVGGGGERRCGGWRVERNDRLEREVLLVDCFFF